MSQYKTGSVNVVSGNSTVTGVGTSFLGNVANGSLFTVSQSGVPYYVDHAVDATHVVLTSNYAGSSANGLAYSITTSFTPNNGFPYMGAGDVDTATIFKAAMVKLDALLGISLIAPTANAVMFVNASGVITEDAANLGYNATTKAFTATGNVAGGNITTTGVMTATGNVAGGNVTTTGTVSATGNVAGGNMTSSGVMYGNSGIGYPVGTGNAVTQSTNKSTAVTMNTVCGNITMNAAALNADTTVSFTLNNTKLAAADMLILNHVAGGTLGSYSLNGRVTAANVGTIDVRNVTTGNLSEALVIRFAIFKAAAS